MGRKARLGKIKKLVAKCGTGRQPHDAPAKKDPQALPSAKLLGLTDKQWHDINALHLKATFKRLDRSVNRYRDSIRILAGGQIESNRSKH
jgi:hypothetical protein